MPILVRDGMAGTITLLGRRFSEPEIAIAEDLGLRVGAAVDNARLYRTRSAIAQTLQQSLLPPELPEIPGVETAALYRPAGEGNEVGGDFYDLFSTGEGEWFAVMGDVCGKGAEAASVTALARYTIRAAVMRNRSPAGILRWLNAAMLRQRAGRFVTIAIARLELEPDGTRDRHRRQRRPPAARGSCAPPGSSRSSARPGRCSACSRTSSSPTAARGWRAGDALVLYTDGLTEVGAPRVWTPRQLDTIVGGARGRERAGHRRPPRRARGGAGRRPAARRPGAARAARSALAVGIDVEVVDLPLAARRPEAELDLVARAGSPPPAAIGDGAHCSPARTTPTGSSSCSPSSVRKTTETFSGASDEPVLRAKKRSVGCATVTQIGAVVAPEPAGRSSERSPARNGWLPSTTAAPPLSVQLPPSSKPPSGAAWYQARSSHGRNVRASGCSGQAAAPAEGAVKARAASAPTATSRGLFISLARVARGALAKPKCSCDQRVAHGLDRDLAVAEDERVDPVLDA